MEVVLSSNYSQQLKGELRSLIQETIKEEQEKIRPTKRYYKRNELIKFLGIGEKTLSRLRENGLKYVPLNEKTNYYDIEEVYEVLETMKR
ncbi:hypothetical protein IR073_01970 [Gemella sp. 19428wG2_WT2a]|nr:hypothetical protein [Gemella sp. 19428wG2_WT2a]TFU60228.1 hypothetical protein E4T67_01955 [Gemella sp. WT2a]